MPLPHPVAIERESKLLLSEIAFLVGFLVGEKAGCNLLSDGQATWDDYRQVPPLELPALSSFDLGDRIDRLQKYVFEQTYESDLADDVELFPLVLGMVFSDAYRADRERRIDDLRSGHDSVATAAAEFYTGALESLVDHAQARYNVDSDLPLSFHQMGLLTGKTEAAVNTAAHRGAFEFSTNDVGRKEANPRDVLTWLKANGYMPTQGTEETWFGDRTPPPPGKGHFVFVPVARDGTWFGPKCQSGGRYTIGPKGEEQKFEDFDEALQHLLQMDPPRWRRPGPTAPGIVTGVRFERMRRDQLDRG